MERAFSRAFQVYCRTPVNRNFSDTADLVRKRVAFNQQLNVLRRRWQAEHLAKLEKEDARKKNERHQVVLQKAIRLRERQAVSAQNVAKDKKLKELAIQRYREHIAKNNAVAQKRKDAVNSQYSKLFTDLSLEEKSWITSHKLADELINESLFEQPATTGLVSSDVTMWKHIAVPFNLDVLFNAGFQERYGPADASPEARYAEAVNNKKIEMRDVINSMVGSGYERQHFDEIVDRFVESYSKSNALLEPSDFLEDEESFVAEMRDESGIEDEEKLFKYIEKQLFAGGSVENDSAEDDDTVDETEDPVVKPVFTSSKQPVKHAGKRSGKKTVEDEAFAGMDAEEKTLDMSIFESAEENMSREFGEDVVGSASAAAAKKAALVKSMGKGAKSSKSK